jgi:RNA polymerase sigma-70 factor (ECF subfamily)
MVSDFQNLSDEDLLGQITAHRSHAAFSELVRRHSIKFRHLAFRFTNTQQDAEDIVQDAFLKLWHRPELWNADKQVKFTTWFYRIITNQCLDFQRKAKPLPIAENHDFEDESPTAYEHLAEKQQRMKVELAFQSLPQNMQTSLNLSFFEPIPNADAAEVMGMSLKAFQSLLFRAKQAFKEKIQAGGQELRLKKGGIYENR